MKVINTLIYGVKSSRNQWELIYGQISPVNEIIQRDIYADDCISGEHSMNPIHETTDNLKVVLSKGFFGLKGFTFSGSDPPKHLNNGEKTINVAGMKWVPKLDIRDLNFGKKIKGKKALI